MKPKRNYVASTSKPGPMDLCQTPPYALEPLMTYLKVMGYNGIQDPRIWEPANGQGILSNALKVADFDVITSDIQTGENFFETQPGKWDVIVTNPPYGIKPQWLRRCYELDKPFALLMPVEFLGTGEAAELFNKYGIEIMILTPRVDFKMPNGWFSSAQFPVAWYCWNILPASLMFEKIQKPKPDISRWRTNKAGKQIKQRGYGDWIERPASFDWDMLQFVYRENI